jgi:hypothetical protein
MNARICSICGGPQARAYRVSGLLLRYVCEDCFVSRCIHCGTACVDKAGKLSKGVTVGIYHAMYCKSCSGAQMEKDIMEHRPHTE